MSINRYQVVFRNFYPKRRKPLLLQGRDIRRGRHRRPCATLSNGTFHAPLNSFKRHETALRKAQQAMRRTVNFSRNRNKAKARVQRLPARIANVRRHYRHKASTTIRLAARANHAMVCIEDLQVRNMSASAVGTRAAPGKNVKAKSGLNKAILDQGWGSSAASWTTRSQGAAAIWSWCRPRIRAAGVRAAAMCRRTTARPRRASRAWHAASKNMPTCSARSRY
jgi:putative transposase